MAIFIFAEAYIRFEGRKFIRYRARSKCYSYSFEFRYHIEILITVRVPFATFSFLCIETFICYCKMCNTSSVLCSILHSVCFQTEIAKRLNAIIAQILPFLSQEHQQQVATAVERAKQVTMTELNAIIGVSAYIYKYSTPAINII